ncbi:VC0807 family protein [Pseudonocardia sp. TRM90224]|uniref:VC0807 family protein n=1 Tax=Pseudonocardia sp. TRM90224 TaxID=2812678 RepID=UPI001E39B5D5|nr:VC0807 family protein [Pseudonocardia sp. TRM90224]
MVNSAPVSTGNPQRVIVMSLLVNAAAPMAIFYGLRAAGVDQWLALMLGLVAPAATTVHSVITKRRIDMIAGLVMTVLLLSVALSFLTGSPRALLARDGVLTAVAGVWILVTLWRTPYYLNALRLFTGGALRDRINDAWRAEPAFRQVVRTCTVIWGSALLLDAGSTVVLAYTLPVDSVPLTGGLKLAALIVLAEVGSRVHFRRKAGPFLVEPAEGGAGRDDR